MTPDTKPGFYYVSVVDGARRAFVKGPYPDHAAALAAVDSVRIEAESRDPRAAFYAFGTARCDEEIAAVLGRPS